MSTQDGVKGVSSLLRAWLFVRSKTWVSVSDVAKALEVTRATSMMYLEALEHEFLVVASHGKDGVLKVRATKCADREQTSMIRLAYKMQSGPALSEFLSAIEHGGSRIELAAASGLSVRSVDKLVGILRAANLAHISDIRCRGRYRIDVHKFGPGADATAPPRMTSQQKSQAMRARRAMLQSPLRGMSVFSFAQQFTQPIQPELFR